MHHINVHGIWVPGGSRHCCSPGELVLLVVCFDSQSPVEEVFPFCWYSGWGQGAVGNHGGVDVTFALCIDSANELNV